jgi:hypothetical protein
MRFAIVPLPALLGSRTTLVILNGLHRRTKSALKTHGTQTRQWATCSTLTTCESVLNDPPDVVMTEVLCRWVVAINSAVDSAAWGNCLDKSADLDPDKLTWLAIDLSPDRRHASLCGAQKLGNEQFVVKLLHTWTNELQLDDKAIANELADYARKYPTEYVLYSRKTSGAVAARLAPAGIPVFDMDNAYPQACDEMLSAINSGRLKHRGQSQLSEEVLAAVQLRRGDGGWVIGSDGRHSRSCAVQSRLHW